MLAPHGWSNCLTPGFSSPGWIEEAVPGQPNQRLPRDEAPAKAPKKNTLTNLESTRPRRPTGGADALARKGGRQSGFEPGTPRGVERARCLEAAGTTPDPIQTLSVASRHQKRISLRRICSGTRRPRGIALEPKPVVSCHAKRLASAQHGFRVLVGRSLQVVRRCGQHVRAPGRAHQA